MLAALTLLLPALALLATRTAAYASLAALPAVMILPALLMRLRRRPPGPTDPGDGGGGDGGSPTPESPNTLPGGGVPLPDAVQAKLRYRGTPRTTLVPARERRRSPEPERPVVPSRTAAARAR